MGTDILDRGNNSYNRINETLEYPLGLFLHYSLTDIKNDIACNETLLSEEDAVNKTKEHVRTLHESFKNVEIHASPTLFVGEVPGAQRKRRSPLKSLFKTAEDTHSTLKAGYFYLIRLRLNARLPETNSSASYIYKIDAATGNIFQHWVDTQTHAQSTIYGKGVGGNPTVGQSKWDGDNLPKVPVTKIGRHCFLANGKVVAYDFAKRNIYTMYVSELLEIAPFSFPCDMWFNDSYNGAYSPLIDTYMFSIQTLEMFNKWALVEPFPEYPLFAYAHVNEYLVNAFYLGGGFQSLFIGSGFPPFYFPLAVGDVVGHEVCHGFTNQHSGLEYHSQSGGMNEAFSDLCGISLEWFLSQTTNYILADGAQNPAYLQGGLRNLCQQDVDGRSIVHASDYYDGINVHYSSGVINKLVCELVKTGKYDLKQVFQLFTYANRFYWDPTANFEEQICGLLKATKRLKLHRGMVMKIAKLVGIKACNTCKKTFYAYESSVKEEPSDSYLGITKVILEPTSNATKALVFTHATGNDVGDVDLQLESDLSVKSVHDGNDEMLTVQLTGEQQIVDLVTKDGGFYENVTVSVIYV